MNIILHMWSKWLQHTCRDRCTVEKNSDYEYTKVNDRMINVRNQSNFKKYAHKVILSFL